MINHDFGKLILRVCVGGLMLFHGIFKLQYGIDGVTGLLESRGLPTFMAYGVYVGEILAPLLILIGYQVRLAALVEIFTMLIAIYSVFGFSIFSGMPGKPAPVPISIIFSLSFIYLFIVKLST